jgi:hypothetical protein
MRTIANKSDLLAVKPFYWQFFEFSDSYDGKLAVSEIYRQRSGVTASYLGLPAVRS